jgi:hypothetical protein
MKKLRQHGTVIENKEDLSGRWKFVGWFNILNVYKKCFLLADKRGSDKSLAQPGRKQARVTEDFEFHLSYL